ncbi:MAG: Ku protein [Desulfovibrionales bacterium]
MPELRDQEIRRRAFWSGTISFGLVSIPVALFPGNRSGGVSLRMLAPDGTPLKRRYYCPKEDIPVERDEIVRGYEIRTNEFVKVTDEELDALEPKKTREIDLRRFVPVEQLDSKFFDRPYFLVPTGQSEKPYRLLARTMERTGRAGIATFVMRTKEYLVAILAEDGILRAETLRFADEVRTPDDIGLPEPVTVSKEIFETVEEAIRKKTADQLGLDELRDRQAQRLKALVQQKRAQGQGIVQSALEEETGEGGGKIIDLMEVLKQSLTQAGQGREAEPREPSDRAAAGDQLAQKSRSELYALAQELEIPGRSAMNKAELANAIRERGFREPAEA